MFDELHDAYLLAVIADGNGGFELRFKTDTGRLRNITLDKVMHLRCEDLREGNIVQCISVVSHAAVGDDAVRWVLGLNENEHVDYVRKVQAQILSGQLSLVELIPSYGAELRALVRKATLGNELRGGVMI